MKTWMTTQFGGGEKLKLKFQSNSREEAIELAERESPPWHVTKVTARPARAGERDDRISLKMGSK